MRVILNKRLSELTSFAAKREVRHQNQNYRPKIHDSLNFPAKWFCDRQFAARAAKCSPRSRKPQHLRQTFQGITLTREPRAMPVKRSPPILQFDSKPIYLRADADCARCLRRKSRLS